VRYPAAIGSKEQLLAEVTSLWEAVGIAFPTSTISVLVCERWSEGLP